MRDYYTLKINLPGGIVSPGTLQTTLRLAYEAGVRTVQFGARQQLLMTVHYESLRQLEKDLQQQAVRYELNNEQYPNISSSYCGEGVFRTGRWVTENEYHTVLDQFDYQPQLKVNIVDPQQRFTPFFTGNLNFIASPDPHFWYLYIRPRQSNTLFCWPVLIYTNEIGRLSRLLEAEMLAHPPCNEAELYRAVTADRSFITQPITQELDIPEFSLPYYEGFNRYGQRLWLGLHRPNEQFAIAFLLDLCALCLKTRIGELCTTPWKSLLIKGIEEKDRDSWSYVLGKHNVNVRHAANGLAWQTEDYTGEGTQLKNYVLRFFEKHDTRTFGLCFGVQTRPKSEVFGSVLIRRRPLLRIGQLALFSLYDIYFTDNFNPNSRVYHLFERGLLKIHVPNQINRLCRQYNTRRMQEPTEVIDLDPERLEPTSTPLVVPVHQCPHCLTVYDAQYGDDRQQVAPGTPFEQLPDAYTCPTCDAPKAELEKMVLDY